MSRLSVAALVLALLAAAGTAHAGPPWMSIEYPANPHDPATRGALAVVHTYHHGAQIGSSIQARAIGLVNGQRTTVTLRVTPTSRTGAYAVRGDIPRGGDWMLVIMRENAGGGERATALVALGAQREVLLVRVPHDSIQSGRWLVPRDPTQAEIDEMLRLTVAMTAAGAGVERVRTTDAAHGARFGRAALPALLLLLTPGAWLVIRRGRRGA